MLLGSTLIPLGGITSTVRLDLDNEPQPDVCLFLDPACGGAARIDADGYIAGAPEFVAEVAASSVSYDLGPKQTAYRCNGRSLKVPVIVIANAGRFNAGGATATATADCGGTTCATDTRNVQLFRPTTS